MNSLKLELKIGNLATPDNLYPVLISSRGFDSLSMARDTFRIWLRKQLK